jgi:hypothetical protein
VKPEDESRSPSDPSQESSSGKAGAPKDLYQALAALDGKAPPEEPEPEPEPAPPEPVPPSEGAPERPVITAAVPEEPPQRSQPLVEEPARGLDFLKIAAAVVAVAVIAWAVLSWVLPSQETSQAANPEPVASPTPDIPAAHITDIAWQQTATATVVTVTGDGLLRSSMVKSNSLGDDRHLIQVLDISEQYHSLELAVGTPQLTRIRTWLHEDRQPTELHIVFDLAGAGIEVGQAELSGSRLMVTLTTAP